MKKRLLSALLAVCLFVAAFSVFVTPANSIDIPRNIQLPYYEEILDFSESTRQVISFTVPYTGYYIIQTFGFTIGSDSEGVTRQMILKQGTSVFVNNRYGYGSAGYGHGALINHYLYEGTLYSLDIWVQGSEQARLSITYAEGLFNAFAPITYYDQIRPYTVNCAVPLEIEFSFTTSNRRYAQVALIQHNDEEARNVQIFIDGWDYVAAFLLDPRSGELFAGPISPQSTDTQMDPGVPYYLVVYLPEGDIYVEDEIIVTVTITLT